jgi:hypothetical protein
MWNWSFLFGTPAASLPGVTAARLSLRFGASRLRARVVWPSSERTGIALVLGDEAAGAEEFLADSIRVWLREHQRVIDDLAVLHWVAVHGADLGASSGAVTVAGGARAARLAAQARDCGWPLIARQVLVRLRFGEDEPSPIGLQGLAPATVVHAPRSCEDGRVYARLLRSSGVEVREVVL